MFFTQFMSWLHAQLQTYISAQTTHAAAALAPAAAALGSVYVMGWGYLHLTGTISEPIQDAARRILTLAVVLGCALHLWLYNDVLVALVVQGPSDLAASLLGAPNPVALVDTIWTDGGSCASTLWNRGGLLEGDIGFYFAGAAVWLIVGLLCLYCAFLLSLSQIAAAVLLALGPLFLLALLFERTRPLFDSWVNQLLNYAMVGLLVALVAALLLGVIASYARQTAALGSALTTVDVLDLLLATGLVLLLLRQILPIASGLAHGVALSTLSSFSNSARLAGRTVLGATDYATRTYVWAGQSESMLDELPPPTAAAATQPRYVTPVWHRPEHYRGTP